MNSGDGKNRPHDGELASAAGPSDAPSTFLTSEAAEAPALVSALDESWRRSLGAVAKRSGFPSAEEPAKLEASLRQLSAAYNDREGGALAAFRSKGLPARLAFSFPRDVPKSAAALREVLGTGLFSWPRERPLRILDLGSGLGATTWGVLRALAATGAQGRVEAVWVEPDEGARGVARALVQERRGREGALSLSVKEVPEGVETALARVGQGFDLILLGQVLSEMHRHMPTEDRVAFHASLVERLLHHHLAPQGLLVVIEPALRDRTRHLHAVRCDLLAKKAGHVVAPCLQEGDCPALSHDHDWCHEDLPVHLPPWLVPLARGAGLRFEGLTFSYLVVSRGKRSIAQAVMPQGSQGPQGLRVVSGNLRTKGKCELLLCGAWPSASPSQEAGTVSLGGRKVSLLDRERADHNAPWADAQRGDILTFDPPMPADSKRVPASTHVTRLNLSSRSFGEASTEASANSTNLGTTDRF